MIRKLKPAYPLRSRVFSALLLASLAFIQPVAAEESEAQDRSHIARHEKRKSAVVFGSRTNDLPRNAVLFYMKKTEAEKFREEHFISFDDLPRCSESKIILDEVFEHTEYSEKLDILYYDPDDSEQVKQARSYAGNLVPFTRFLYLNPETQSTDFFQSFARMINISCLPTRFRFTYVGNKRYAEFRLGAKAWESK